MRVLNVGGGPRSIPLPSRYDNWEQVWLDIDPACKPDIVLDARELPIEGQKFDAIYCSHNLEHYHRHDALRVLRGFVLSLTENGFAHIKVPDIGEVMRRFVYDPLDIEGVVYDSPMGPITVHDMIYGFGVQIQRSGNEYYAHKTGFTMKLMKRMLSEAGFRMMEYAEHKEVPEIEVFAYLRE